MRIRFDRVLLQTGAIAALLLLSTSTYVFADNADTQAQLQRLENEIQTLSRAVFKGEQPPAGAISTGNDSTQADIQNRLSQIEMNIQSLTGKIEEQGNEINTLKDQLAHANTTASAMPVPSPHYGMNAATDTAIQNPAQTAPVVIGPSDVSGSSSSYTYTSHPSGGSDATPADDSFSMADPNAPAPTNAPTAGKLGTIITNTDPNGIAPGTPMAEYEAAFALLRNQDYPAAQIAFDKFIKQNPTNPLVGNAMYWLGETYYVRNQFEPATKIFAEAYQKYPQGAKAPDNLLKLGLSLAGQGKTKDACVALAQLKKQYPAGAAPVLTRGDQAIEQLKCNVR
jgi:tol-pal system protein YbgF